MTQSAADLDSTFRRAWTLLIENLIVVVPGLVAGIPIVILALILFFSVAAGVVLAAAGASSATSVAGMVIMFGGVIVGLGAILAIAVMSVCFTTGMSGVAWEVGKTNLADGWNAFKARGWELFLAGLVLFPIGLVAIALAPVTLLISLILYMIFFMYTAASVVVGGNSAMHAIGESCRLASRNFWPSAGVAAIVLVAACVGAGLAAAVGKAMPFAGGTLGAALEQAAAAYAAMVIVGEYAKLRKGALEPAT